MANQQRMNKVRRLRENSKRRCWIMYERLGVRSSLVPMDCVNLRAWLEWRLDSVCPRIASSLIWESGFNLKILSLPPLQIKKFRPRLCPFPHHTMSKSSLKDILWEALLLPQHITQISPLVWGKKLVEFRMIFLIPTNWPFTMSGLLPLSESTYPKVALRVQFTVAVWLTFEINLTKPDRVSGDLNTESIV